VNARRLAVAALVLVLVALASACGGSGSPTTVTLVTHDSFAMSDSVRAEFEKESGLKLRIVQLGDAGAMLNRVILTKDRPLGDVIFGVDNTFLSRAVGAGIAAPYTPRAAARIATDRTLDPTHALTPIDRGAVCVNADRAWFQRKGLAIPRTLDDLVSPAYRGLLVTESPATSSPGLVFLLAIRARYGAAGVAGYLARLKGNGVHVVSGWDQAYTADFSGSTGKGAYPLVTSYGTSPPAEVGDSATLPAQSPTVAIEGTCFDQVEFAGVLEGGHEKQGRALVDFLLSGAFQADMPEQMYVLPVIPGVALPPSFARFALDPKRPLSLDPATIARERDGLIALWKRTVEGS
jgi:thiamine transport system substrate-binding protein